MKLFSHSTKEAAETGIPSRILDAVTVMGDAPRPHPSHEEGKGEAQARSASPFLDNMASETPAPVTESAPESPKTSGVWDGDATPTLKPLFDEKEATKPWEGKNKKWFFGALVVILVALVGGGIAWYLLSNASSEEEKTETPPVEFTTPPTPPAPEPPFSLHTPNYLSLDTETITAQGLQTLLNEAGARIVAANILTPIEFLPTDKNNNPLAFSRFAYLVGIALPEESLATIGEPFSLFLYNENGTVKKGLKLSFVDAAAGANFLQEEEARLPLFFRSLFFEGFTLPQPVVFRSGVYKSDAVRFVNIDAARNISFDYVLRGKEWVMGTSKDTLRAILDKTIQ